MTQLLLQYNKVTGEHFLAQIDRSVYESTVVLCAKKCVGGNPQCMCVQCELTIRHASRLRSRCTGQAAFKTFMKQTVLGCGVYL